MRLKGKVAIVTGSSRGIGKGIAQRLAAEGARIAVNGLERADISSVKDEICVKGGSAIGVVADVSRGEGVDMLFERTLAEFGVIDVLVNNAGWADPIAHFLDTSEEMWDKVINTNLKSVYLCSLQAAKAMINQKRGGSIINISSYSAARAHRNMVAYDASKGGIEAATRAMALDLAPWGIRVNAVGPGCIRTERWQELTEKDIQKRRVTVPLGREGTPADIAGTVIFFASDDSSYVTGQVLYVDGGMLAQLRSVQAEVV